MPTPPDTPPLRFLAHEINGRGTQLFGDNEFLVGQLNLLQQFDSFELPVIPKSIHYNANDLISYNTYFEFILI